MNIIILNKFLNIKEEKSLDKITLKTKISIDTIKLLNAIEYEDIVAVRSLISVLNESIAEMEIIDFNEYYKITLDNFILFENLLKKYSNLSTNQVNECLQYVLFNFKHIHNKKILEWKQLIQPLFISRDYNQINNFIEDQLAGPKGQLYSYEFDDMIKLASFTNNFHKLKLLQEAISAGRMRE